MKKPSVEIHYCPGCKWLPRSTWMAQELLETFGNDLASVALFPAEESGTFKITLNLTHHVTLNANLDTQVVWNRTVDGGFPQIKELKQRVRDIIAPERELGHLDP